MKASEHEFTDDRAPAHDGKNGKVAYRRRYLCPCGQHADDGLLFLVRLHGTSSSQAV